MTRLLVVITVACMLAWASAALAADGEVPSSIAWTMLAGIANLVVVIGIGIIGWFLRGALAKIDTTAADHEHIKGELRGKIAVLEERMNGVVDLKTALAGLRGEVLTRLDSFRDEWRADATELRKDIRATEDRHRRSTDG